MSDKKEKVYVVMPCGKKFEDSNNVGLKLIEHLKRCSTCKIIGYQHDVLFKKLTEQELPKFGQST